jgi:hypothetical protein
VTEIETKSERETESDVPRKDRRQRMKSSEAMFCVSASLSAANSFILTGLVTLQKRSNSAATLARIPTYDRQ